MPDHLAVGGRLDSLIGKVAERLLRCIRNDAHSDASDALFAFVLHGYAHKDLSQGSTASFARFSAADIGFVHLLIAHAQDGHVVRHTDPAPSCITSWFLLADSHRARRRDHTVALPSLWRNAVLYHRCVEMPSRLARIADNAPMDLRMVPREGQQYMGTTMHARYNATIYHWFARICTIPISRAVFLAEVVLQRYVHLI